MFIDNSMINEITVSDSKDNMSTRKCPYHCIMSKKRYKEIEQAVRFIEPDDEKYETIMRSIKDIMRFDPESKSVTPDHVDKIRLDRQRRAREQGISIYKLLKYDEKHANRNS